MKNSTLPISEKRPEGRTEAPYTTGFNDGRLAAQNIEDLKRFSGISEIIPELIDLALNSPNPDASLTFLERYLSSSSEKNIETEYIMENLPVFIQIFGSSEFLSSILVRKPDEGMKLISSPYLKKIKTLDIMKTELKESIADASDYAALLSALRLYKHKEMLRIGARDLMGYGTIEEITEELSSLASASLDTAYSFCLEQLKKDYGTPCFRDKDGNLNECGFTILGMGKLGGNELNFSSDIDLICLYESDEGEARSKSRTYTLYEFFCKLTEQITKAISSNTEDGFVFRVDLRLRPEGQNGPLVNSLRSAEIYYESWGETWERSAMLKARPVAGNIELGNRFLNDMEPFIYRKYLDFSTVEDIKEMKLKIDRELALKPGMWDVKLGSGGIREIEFLVQASQLIYAGKERFIREKNTMKALAKLHEKGIFSGDDCQSLTAAYKFLRTVEHRIQVENERQTHKLPSKEEDIKRLAKRCGFKTVDGFKEILNQHSKRVERLYDGIFHEPSKSIEEIPPDISRLFVSEPDKGEIIEKLHSIGFEMPENAFDRLQNLRDALPSVRLTQRNRTALRKLAPSLFLETVRSPDPDMASANLDRFLCAAGARGSFYSLLIENPKIVRFLATLFGSSDFLSQFLISHPELLDSLLTADTVTPIKTGDELGMELASAVDKASGYEEILDSARRFRNTELIRIGINDIAEEIGLTDTCSQLTALAELSLELALRVSDKELRSRFGHPVYQGKEAVMTVLGMGKLGGREMNYSSDLDIIFVFSGAGETEGPRIITNQEYFAKVAQRVISFLTLQTREGYLYKVDTRLRPSGSAGALVASLDAFERYHQESSKLWERQALIKARAVAGNMEMGNTIMRKIDAFVYGRGIDDKGRDEIIHLRNRMEKELAKEGPQRYNVKTGRGGIVDIEFTVQFLQLKYGRELAGIRGSNTLNALTALKDEGVISSEDHASLSEAYLFLMKAENRLRIVHNISTDQMDLEPGKAVKLAKRLGYDGRAPDELFLKDYRRYTEKVREIYNRFLIR